MKSEIRSRILLLIFFPNEEQNDALNGGVQPVHVTRVCLVRDEGGGRGPPL